MKIKIAQKHDPSLHFSSYDSFVVMGAHLDVYEGCSYTHGSRHRRHHHLISKLLPKTKKFGATAAE